MFGLAAFLIGISLLGLAVFGVNLATKLSSVGVPAVTVNPASITAGFNQVFTISGSGFTGSQAYIKILRPDGTFWINAGTPYIIVPVSSTGSFSAFIYAVNDPNCPSPCRLTINVSDNANPPSMASSAIVIYSAGSGYNVKIAITDCSGASVQTGTVNIKSAATTSSSPISQPAGVGAWAAYFYPIPPDSYSVTYNGVVVGQISTSATNASFTLSSCMTVTSSSTSPTLTPTQTANQSTSTITSQGSTYTTVVANPTISVTPTSIFQGSSVSVVGSGFGQFGIATLQAVGPTTLQLQTSSGYNNGNFLASLGPFNIPGTYTIYALDSHGTKSNSVMLQVTGYVTSYATTLVTSVVYNPVITVTPSQVTAKPGSSQTFTVTGSGFPDSGGVTVYFIGPTSFSLAGSLSGGSFNIIGQGTVLSGVYQVYAVATTNLSGVITGGMLIYTQGGTIIRQVTYISLSGYTAISASSFITVNVNVAGLPLARITINPSNVVPQGGSVYVTGYGFSQASTVYLFLTNPYYQSVVSTQTDASGSFFLPIAIGTPAGTYNLYAVDGNTGFQVGSYQLIITSGTGPPTFTVNLPGGQYAPPISGQYSTGTTTATAVYVTGTQTFTTTQTLTTISLGVGGAPNTQTQAIVGAILAVVGGIAAFGRKQIVGAM